MSTTTFITDDKGKKISAILPIKLYQHLLEELEELKDILPMTRPRPKKENPSLSVMPFDKDAKGRKPEYTVLILPSA